MQYFFSLGLGNKTSGFECKCAKYGNQWDVVVIGPCIFPNMSNTDVDRLGYFESRRSDNNADIYYYFLHYVQYFKWSFCIGQLSHYIQYFCGRKLFIAWDFDQKPTLLPNMPKLEGLSPMRSNNKADKIALKARGQQPIKRSVPVSDLLGHMQGSCCNIWYGYQALFVFWYTNLLHSRILTHYYDYWLWLHKYHLQLVYEYLLCVHVFPYTFFDMHSFTYRHQ